MFICLSRCGDHSPGILICFLIISVSPLSSSGKLKTDIVYVCPGSTTTSSKENVH